MRYIVIYCGGKSTKKQDKYKIILLVFDSLPFVVQLLTARMPVGPVVLAR